MFNPPFEDNWILYADDELVAVNKPSGLLSVPGRLPENKYSLLSALEEGLQMPLHVVHRLDMDTSGVMVFAKNKTALRHLNKQFQDRKTQKRYHAVCGGTPSQPQGNIYLPMRCDWERRPRQIVDLKQGKACHTEWKVLTQRTDRFLVELIPHTGRSHQLRVHMKMLGHPILGDNLYADSICRSLSPRLLLHATDLQIQHPITEKPLDFHAPIPF
jgi:tRNA pseudouridine32 synthase/23S rRNA pseudouridine746 synthase